MSSKPVSYYAEQIRHAKSKQELEQISYRAFRDDPQCMANNPKMNRITAMCVLREVDLGYLPREPKSVSMYRRIAKTGK